MLSSTLFRSSLTGLRSVRMFGSSTPLDRMTGSVLWFNTEKGYGFLKPNEMAEGTNDNVFVHYTGIRGTGFRTLEAEMNVEFDVVEVEGKQRAVDVVVKEGGEQ